MYVFIAIAVMALVTYIPRSVPLTLFNKNIKSVYIKSFLHYTPYAVLGAMTFPSILYSTNNMVYSLIGTIIAIMLAYFKRSLLTVAVITVAAVYFCNVFFKG